MNRYTEVEVEGYERVVRCDNGDVGFVAWVAIHDSTLGPALGGCRLWNYDSQDAALTDVLRLSKGMTYKNALAGLGLGGGKSVIHTDPAVIDRRQLFTNFGQFIEYLGGQYITAEDVNTTLADMEEVKKQTDHVATVGASGNPSPFTAYGVYCGIRESVAYKLQKRELAGLTVALQGVGETGGRLAELLAGDGCRIVVADINKQNIAALARNIPLEQIEPEAIYTVTCDIFSPCALGGILNAETISSLQCSIIAGSANNQLLEEQDGDRLRRKGILYAPDYAINAGGVINICCEIGQPYDPAQARVKTAGIADCLRQIYTTAEEQGVATNIVANQLAEKIILERKMAQQPLIKTG